MRLSAGARLGSYEILAPLGAGGMGEVHRARDTKLERDVAIKVLPDSLAEDADALARFKREALSVAALSHPNILSIFDFGEQDGVVYAVMELLEGETLRDLLSSGPLPQRRAVDHAVQVATGLSAAHAKGIVHRDLKPENLFVTTDGRVKILDFGLAKRVVPAREALATAGATASQHTERGTVLGTLGYMSPEQARGDSIDHRSDIFSFGSILYEMLTGQKAFQRTSRAETMAAILKEEPPPPSETGLRVAPMLDSIVRHCLEKSPDARFQSAHDVVFALEQVRTANVPSGVGSAAPSGSNGSVAVAPEVVASSARSRRNRFAAFVALGLAVAAVLGFLLGKRAVPARSPQPSLIVPRVIRLTDLAGIEEFPAISPDGKSVAFTAYAEGRRQIFVRLIAGGPPLQITREPADHQMPRWSPDSSSIVYYSPPAALGEIQGTVSEIPALGGSSRRLAESTGGADASLVDGRIAYFRLTGERVELVTAPRDASASHVVARLKAGSYYLYPRWSPDGRWIAFQRGDGVRFDLFVVPSAGGEPRQSTHDQTLINGFAWLPDGTGLVFSSSRASSLPYLPTFTLWEARLKDGRLQQLTSTDGSLVNPDVNRSGAVVAGRARTQFDIWKFPVDRQPRENVRAGLRMTRQTGDVQTPTAAPGDREVAFLSDSGGHANLWVISTGTGEWRQITYERDPGVAVGVPVWSPDGKSIAFVSSRDNLGLRFGLWLVNPDGSNLRRVVTHGFGAAWSSDGRWLYYVEPPDDVLKRISPDGGPSILVRTESARNVIGSHGSTLYYTRERPLVDGRPEFEIRAATPENGPSRLLARIPASRVASWQIVNPALSPDGKWLAQPLTDQFTTNIWALSTSTGEWRQITDFDDRPTMIARRVSWSSDGRFVFAAVGEGDADIVRLEGLVNPASD
ncbi:MAG TPA: protein kinase [Thermoanaerobaculia bacterium]|jgi:Tol biopolymer transport system component|nr:protein kinase [Thermoanaerobaculia bacterium]